MEIDELRFSELGFSTLFQHYISGTPEVTALFGYPPFDFERAAASFKFSGNRADTVDFLRSFNSVFGDDASVSENIDKLGQPDALCIVTGQQLTVFGGPLYTYLKTITAIVRAKQLSETLKRPVLPVFWLADEDHDFDEIASISVPASGTWRQFRLENDDSGAPAGSIPLPESINTILDELFSVLPATEFTGDMREKLSKAYKPGITHREAFGRWIRTVFHGHGLILAGSNAIGAKKILQQKIADAVRNSDDVMKALSVQTKQAEAFGHAQAAISESLLFGLDPATNRRTRIHKSEETWITDTGKTWTTEQLLTDIEDHPDRFSPNVLLRPVLQDALLPTLAYVGGPGEIAYYAQLKELYPVFGQIIPVITPRFSATMIESSVNRLLENLPFSVPEFMQRIEDLESAYLRLNAGIDADRLSEEWEKQLRELSVPFIRQIIDEDPTLQGASEKMLSEFSTSVDRLKSKFARSQKQKMQVSIDRIHRVKTALFPDGGLQERILPGIWFMNRYGMNFWQQLIHNFEKKQADSHFLIRL